MEFKDYYATLGVERSATQDEVKRSYRKLARKFHPDVSKETDAEAKFKEVAEAYEVLGDVEKRAAYDDLAKRPRRGPDFEPPPDWDRGFEFSGRGADGDSAPDFSAFFESLFGRRSRGAAGEHAPMDNGRDHHAKIAIDLEDAYRGARRTLSLRMPTLDARGLPSLQERQLDVNIPKGVREHQQLRLAGQGGAGIGGGGNGDLYLEIVFNPHPRFRADGRDVYLDLPLAPWEAALGASVTVPMPDGGVELTIPPNSAPGRRLRLKGKGLPSSPPGDLYVLLSVRLPGADTPAAKEAWAALSRSFPTFNPRSDTEA